MTNAPEVADKPAETPTVAAAPAPAKWSADKLQQSTARFTRPAWDIYLSLRNSEADLKTKPIQISLQALSEKAAKEIGKTLETEGVSTRELYVHGSVVQANTTFADLQLVIKHPETHLVDLGLA